MKDRNKKGHYYWYDGPINWTGKQYEIIYRGKKYETAKNNRDDTLNFVHITCIDSLFHHNRSWNEHRIYKPFISTPLWKGISNTTRYLETAFYILIINFNFNLNNCNNIVHQLTVMLLMFIRLSFTDKLADTQFMSL